MKSIDLVGLGGLPDCGWPLGTRVAAPVHPREFGKFVEGRVTTTAAEGCLFWDPRLGSPDPAEVQRISRLPGDVWHAGLALGTAGLPQIFDFAAPNWTLIVDPDSSVVATSWRLSLRACLIPCNVMRQMGTVMPCFESLDAAALELGLRYIRRGVLTRHTPALAPPGRAGERPRIGLSDEIRFVRQVCSRTWAAWAVGRAVASGYANPLRAAGEWMRCPRPTGGTRAIFRRRASAAGTPAPGARVTVLVPTVDRYPYLRVLLRQLAAQTVRPWEIIIVDQTVAGHRDDRLEQDFPNLPLRIYRMNEAGQCTSRNLGLAEATGDHILFLDDDDEIEADLIERHLANLEEFQADVSCGVAHEAGAGALPEDFTFLRASNVFPTNNTLIRRPVLDRSGLFDLTYNRGQRADADLGMRIYQSGALMVLNPSIGVLHHHAPVGGLRKHKARVVTYASSRGSLWQRHLPTVTEIYLAKRYFSPRQVREGLWVRALGSFSVRGNLPRRLTKAAISLLCLPDTVRRIVRAGRKAERLLQQRSREDLRRTEAEASTHAHPARY